MTGKEKCRYLKSIRKDIAEKNDIDIKFEKCTSKGHCCGTCPKCDAELQLINDKLNEKAKRGEQIVIPAGHKIKPKKRHLRFCFNRLRKKIFGRKLFSVDDLICGNAASITDERADRIVNIGMSYGSYHTKDEIERVRNDCIDAFDLSAMAYSCMRAAGINTVKDILAMSEKDLNELKNTNVNCYYELIYAVSFWGLEFDYVNKNK